MKKILYIIPARGGSKGIPRKNVREFLGTPLIAYPVNQALSLTDPLNVCVSTDDEEIKRSAEDAGAIVPFMRPASLADDNASSRDVMLHALDFYRDKGIDYDTIVLLQPTSPLRNIDDIRKALSVYEKAQADGIPVDMAVTVTEAECNPYYNAFEPDIDGFLHISKGDGTFTRRQDAPKVWRYNGAVYVINAESLRRMPMALFKCVLPVEMPTSRSLDLDTEVDWLVAEYVASRLK